MTALITKRNLKFSSAIAELLVACAAHQPPQDALELLLAATDENLPVHPSEGDGEGEKKGLGEKKADLAFFSRNPDMRPSVEELIDEIRADEAYKGQIVDEGHRVFEAREAILGASLPPRPPSSC